MKRFLRTAQSYFPFLRPLKFSAYNLATRRFGWHIVPEFLPLAKLAPVSLALDIGGNWGQSIHAIKRVVKPTSIISFEPNAALADRLTRVFARDPSVEVRAIALSDREGSFNLFVPRYRSFIYDGLASLDEQEARTWLNKGRMMGFDPGQLTLLRQTVPVTMLDQFDLTPDIVKIDVQGMEESVVRGGIKMFERTKPVSIVEAPSQRLVEVFGDLGLRPYWFDGTALRKGWQHRPNVLFASDARREKMN